MRTEKLPTAKYVDGKYLLSDPYDEQRYVQCKPYGEMNEGTMVWIDQSANQYTRSKFYGKFYFVVM